MFLRHFQLREQPFGVTPDPRFLYLSSTHREAMASLAYGITANRGFTALAAQPGMGKTTILFDLLGRYEKTHETAFVFQAHQTPASLLHGILWELGVQVDGNCQDLVRLHSQLNDYLLRIAAAGKRVLIVIDEAQSLSEPVLEQLRMLSNFETAREKLLHILVAGQPGLATLLASPQMEQLRQRVSIIARLAPLHTSEVCEFVEHRMRVAGCTLAVPPFTKQAFEMIARQSGGIPRNINNICFNALSLACALKRMTVNREIVAEVTRDLDLSEVQANPEIGATRAHQTAASGFAPTRTAPYQRKSTFRSFFRISTVLGACVVLTGILTWGVRGADPSAGAIEAISRPAIAVANRPAQSSPANVIPNAASPAEQQPQQFEIVRIQPNETISGIARKRYGKYDEHVLQQLRALNPWLLNTRLVETGRDLKVPVTLSQRENSFEQVRAGNSLNSAKAR